MRHDKSAGWRTSLLLTLALVTGVLPAGYADAHASAAGHTKTLDRSNDTSVIRLVGMLSRNAGHAATLTDKFGDEKENGRDNSAGQKMSPDLRGIVEDNASGTKKVNVILQQADDVSDEAFNAILKRGGARVKGQG
ncbi:MAG: hypothetical protein M3458_03225 [Acidobacteriota bacterium]|nr:hypothetical protein [Acidobacteriota bacterium]